MDLTDIIGFSDSDRILISQHAKNRMFERSINLEDILSCLAECDIIAKYEDDKPFPSCLVLGKDKHGQWLLDQGKWYFLGEDGGMLANQWLYEGGKWYFLNLSK